ncbi:redox-regulated ATPase YchF [Candidatus Pacearchaeota archaeon CG10_big_fil_rev_8_21_14_0_10_35_13]|nr:MAG: redox-regulated ATPase YchF [Candidatus Pacearchaeota archaeon CG10_big_fil_rev_8_21_14_0_10_35_13]
MLIGLVGAPNVGKSTFFKSATLAEALIANYPFATIKPNHGIGYVKIRCIDKEFTPPRQCNPREGVCIDGWRFVPVEMLDVAGLVPGASENKGLGNQFLDDLRQADAFIQIVDMSGQTNEEGKPTKEEYDPCKSIEFLIRELDLWYAGILKKVWKVFARTTEMVKDNFAEAVAKQFSGLKVTEEDVKIVIRKTGYNPERPTTWNDEQLTNFAGMLRMITKPMIIAANKMDQQKSEENLKRAIEKFPEYVIIPCSAEGELMLRMATKEGIIKYLPGEKNYEIISEKINDKQKQALEFIKENVLEKYGSTGVQEIINKVVLEMLKYIAIFPAGTKKLEDSKGNVLPDCYFLPEGSTALDFAYKLHTDLGDNFIKAIDVRTKQIIGKEHVLKHRDGIEIITR